MQVVLMEKLHISLKEANKLTLLQLVTYMGILKKIHTREEPEEDQRTKLSVDQSKINELRRQSEARARQLGKM